MTYLLGPNDLKFLNQTEFVEMYNFIETLQNVNNVPPSYGESGLLYFEHRDINIYISMLWGWGLQGADQLNYVQGWHFLQKSEKKKKKIRCVF